MSRTSQTEWAKRVERWRDSGLTAKEFAAETGVNASTLAYWSWRLRASRSKRPTSRPSPSRSRFVELTPSSVSTTSPVMLELVLGEGVRIRIPSGFDEETLARVVRAVGSTP